MKGARAVKGEFFEKPDAKPDAQGKREEELFTPVSKSEAWVVEAASGKHFSSSALKPTTVFQDLKNAALRALALQHRAPADAVEDPQMSGLRYDDDSEEHVEATPVRKRRRSSAATDQVGVATPEKKAMTQHPAVPVVVRMKQSATASDEELHDVRVVLQGKTLLLGVSSVPWLIGYLMEEMEDEGVAMEAEASADAEPGPGTIYWDFRDESWVAKVRTHWSYLVKRFPIRSRMQTPGDPLHGMSRKDAKEAAEKEAVAWFEAALRGEVEETGAPAAAATVCV